VLTILGENCKALARQAVSQALQGDTGALRLALERLAPPRKDAPVTFALPRMESARDAAEAAGAVLQACAAGELTPSEAAAVMALIEAYRRTLETSELEARVAALESNVRSVAMALRVKFSAPYVSSPHAKGRLTGTGSGQRGQKPRGRQRGTPRRRPRLRL
jgi:hypothetical protein